MAKFLFMMLVKKKLLVKSWKFKRVACNDILQAICPCKYCEYSNCDIEKLKLHSKRTVQNLCRYINLKYGIRNIYKYSACY